MLLMALLEAQWWISAIPKHSLKRGRVAPDLLLQGTEIVGCKGGKEKKNQLRALHHSLYLTLWCLLPSSMHASHAPHVAVNFCSSENGTTHFPMQADEDICIHFLQLGAEGCHFLIRFNIVGALRFLFFAAVEALSCTVWLSLPITHKEIE